MVSNELLQRDRVLLAIIGLLSYFTLSGVLAPMGLLIDPISAQFNVSDVVAARLLSGFSSGNLLGAVLALFVMSWFGYKRIVIAIYASAAAILLSLGFASHPALVWFLLAGLGLTLGIGLAVAAQLIAVIYKSDQRAALLVATDSSFSLAGTVMAGLTKVLLAVQIFGTENWTNPYLPILVVALLIVTLASITRYPAPEISTRSWRWLRLMPWSVWSVGASLFAYTLGQTTVLLWLPTALASEELTLSLGAETVGRYWMGMFIGQLTAVILVIWIGRRKCYGWRFRCGSWSVRVTYVARSTRCASLGVAPLGYPKLRSVKNVDCPGDRCSENPPRCLDSWVVAIGDCWHGH